MERLGNSMNRVFVFARNLHRQLSACHRAIRTFIFRTDVNFWRQVAVEEPGWDDRNHLIAQAIPADSSVLDLGSGAQTLARYLKLGCTYQPCDCVKSSDNVLLCDFNRDQYPTLDRRFDYVVVSGLLEYIRDPRSFLKQIHAYGNVLLISYACLLPGHTRLWRASQGWVNHLTRPELEGIFNDLGLRWSEMARWQDQIIYHVVEK